MEYALEADLASNFHALPGTVPTCCRAAAPSAALKLLGGGAACGVGGNVCDVKAPLGFEGALAFVVFEYRVQDVEDVQDVAGGNLAI